MSWNNERRSRDYADNHRRTHRSHREDGRQPRSDHDDDYRRSQRQRDYDDVNDHRYRSDYDSERRNRNGSGRRYPSIDYTNSSRQKQRCSNDLNDDCLRSREQSSRSSSMLNHVSQQNFNRTSSSNYASEWFRGESDFTQQPMLGGYSIPSPPREVIDEPLNNTEDAEEEALKLLEEVDKLEAGNISDIKTEIPDANPEQYEIYYDDFLSYPENGPVPEWYQKQLDVKVKLALSRIDYVRNRVCWSDDQVKEQIELMEMDHKTILCKMDEPRHPKVDQAWFNTWKFDCRQAVICGSFVPGHVHTQDCEKNSFIPLINPNQQSLPYEIPKYISEIVQEITEFTNTAIESNSTVNINKPEWKWIKLRSNYKCEVLVVIGAQYIKSIISKLKRFCEDRLFKTTKISSISYVDLKQGVKNKSTLPIINLCGELTMLDKVGNVCVQYDHKTNMQFNAVEFNILGKVIHEYLDPESHTTIIDIGSTIGLLGCMMGNKNCAKVIGLTDSRHGMELAESIKSLNNINKATFMECDKDKVYSKTLSLTTSCSSVVILNLNSVYGRYPLIYDDIRKLPTVWRLVIYGCFKPDYVKYFTKLTNTNDETGEPFLPIRYCVLDKSPSNTDEFIIVLLLERSSLVDGKTKPYKEAPTMNVGSENLTSGVVNNHRNEAAPINDNVNIFRIPTQEPNIPLFTTVTHGEVFSIHCNNPNLIGSIVPDSEWKLHKISFQNPYFKTYREIPANFINMEIDARYQRHLELRNQLNTRYTVQQTVGNSSFNSEKHSRNVVESFIPLDSRVENPYNNNFRNNQQVDENLSQSFNLNSYPENASETLRRREDKRVENPFNRQGNSRDPRNKLRTTEIQSTESRNLTFENRGTNALNEPRLNVNKVKLGLNEYKNRSKSSDSSELNNLEKYSSGKDLHMNQSTGTSSKKEDVCKDKSSKSQYNSQKNRDEVHKVRSTTSDSLERHQNKMDGNNKEKSLVIRSTSKKQKKPDAMHEKKSTNSTSLESHQKKKGEKDEEVPFTSRSQISNEKLKEVCEKKLSTSESRQSHEKSSTSTLQTQNEKSKKGYEEKPSSGSLHSSCSVQINKSPPSKTEKDANHESRKDRKHHKDKSHKHHKHKSHKKKSERSRSSSHKSSSPVQQNLNSLPTHIEQLKYIKTEPESGNTDNNENMNICLGSQLSKVKIENMDQRENPYRNSNQEFLPNPVVIKTEPSTTIGDQKCEYSDSDIEILPPVKKEPVYIADSDEDILVPKTDKSFTHDSNDELVDEQSFFVPLPDKLTRNTNQLKFLFEVVQKLWEHKYGWAFQGPMLSNKMFKLNNYSEIVREHMDLNTIKKRLENKFYWSSSECLNDFQIMFENVFSCMNEEENVLHMMTKKMKNFFDELIIDMPSEEFGIDEEDLWSMATPKRVSPTSSQKEDTTCSLDGVQLATKASYLNDLSNTISSFKFQELLRSFKNESSTVSEHGFEAQVPTQVSHTSVNQMQQQPELTLTPIRITTVKQEPEQESNVKIQSQLGHESVNQIEQQTELAQMPSVTVKQESDSDIQLQLDHVSENQLEQKTESAQTPLVTVKQEPYSSMEIKSKLDSEINKSTEVVTQYSEQNLTSLPLSLRIASNFNTVKVKNEPNEESNQNLVNSDFTNFPITTHFTKTEYFLTETSDNLNLIDFDSVGLKVENEFISEHETNPHKIMDQSEYFLTKTSLKSEYESSQGLTIKNEVELNALKDMIKPELSDDTNLNNNRKRSSKENNEGSLTKNAFYLNSNDNLANQTIENSAKRPRLSYSNSEGSPEAVRSYFNHTYHLNLTGLNDSTDQLRESPSTSPKSSNSNELESSSSDSMSKSASFLGSIPNL
ncbi:hypothetical protein TKK_0010960 [Trichogramma kaykai]|uniref:Bromo domain-containing protein n=1 Tax=Trichogramma kaykai TaxID=54128 RepID=A0ABD2WVH3_9HYME